VKEEEVGLKEDPELSEVESDDLVDTEELLGKGKRVKMPFVRLRL
jgi:hypothetical protein